jgi:hypothetical protein
MGTKQEFTQSYTLFEAEYWIIDGEAVLADVDINDMSHEAYVIQHLASIFLNYFDIDTDYPETLDKFEQEILNYFIDTGIIEDENQKEEYNNDPANFILNYLLKNHLRDFNNDEKQLTDAFFLAYGSSGMMDARNYGMKYLGWIRIAGNNIQLWKISNESLNNISRGLNSVFEQESKEDSEIQESTYNIEFMKTKKYFVDVPITVIDSGDITQLLAYR